MILHPDKERMVGQFYNLYQSGFRIAATGDHPVRFKLAEVIVIEFITVAVSFADHCCAIDPVRQ